MTSYQISAQVKEQVSVQPALPSLSTRGAAVLRELCSSVGWACLLSEPSPLTRVTPQERRTWT